MVSHPGHSTRNARGVSGYINVYMSISWFLTGATGHGTRNARGVGEFLVLSANSQM